MGYRFSTEGGTPFNTIGEAAACLAALMTEPGEAAAELTTPSVHTVRISCLIPRGWMVGYVDRFGVLRLLNVDDG